MSIVRISRTYIKQENYYILLGFLFDFASNEFDKEYQWQPSWRLKPISSHKDQIYKLAAKNNPSGRATPQ